MSMIIQIFLLLLLTPSILSKPIRHKRADDDDSRIDFVRLACSRNPDLAFCAPYFESTDAPKSSFQFTINEANDDDDDSAKTNQQTNRINNNNWFGSFDEINASGDNGLIDNREVNKDNFNQQLQPFTTQPPSQLSNFNPQSSTVMPAIFYTIYPHMISKGPHYCYQNQQLFWYTCRPGVPLRYDLQMFCNDYSLECSIANLNLLPDNNGRPADGMIPGFGQKLENGHVGVGQSVGIGIGAIPGLNIRTQTGVDVGSVPLIDQMGGVLVNQGTNVGILGQNIGRGPARAMAAMIAAAPFGLNGGGGEPSYGSGGGMLGGLPSQRKSSNPALTAAGVPVETGIANQQSIGLPMGLGSVDVASGIGVGVGK